MRVVSDREPPRSSATAERALPVVVLISTYHLSKIQLRRAAASAMGEPFAMGDPFAFLRANTER
ncbi:MAG: hypothetical protein MUF54_03005 [Polyangiaceae bacterium]|jgi:hypothetical protein|nr:hypothetical protein [Polyangiaceae bacterium]